MSTGRSFAEVAGVGNPEQFLPTTRVRNGSVRDALVNIVMRALRSEAGVRLRQTAGKGTGYYAGRRAGFICAAAVLAEELYNVDYDQAKDDIGKGVQKAGEGWIPMDLVDPGKSGMLATDIVNKALQVAY